MAVPVITSAPIAETPTGVRFRYKITASGRPTSYTSTTMPLELVFDTALGTIDGKIRTAAVYPITLTATNVDGTSAPFVLTITAIDAGGGGPPPPPNSIINVYQSK